MKQLGLAFLGVVSAAALLSTEVSAETINGVVQITLTGTLRLAGTGYTTVDCSAHVVLIPTTASTVTLSAAGLLSWLSSAYQSANAHTGFDYSTAGSSISGVAPNPPSNAGSVTGFTCMVRVPYTFTNAVGGQSSRDNVRSQGKG